MVLQADLYSGVYPTKFNDYSQFLHIRKDNLIEESIVVNNVLTIIECDLESKLLTVSVADTQSGKRTTIIRSDMIENGVIDISKEGLRWEGGCVNQSPCGFGRLYNELNYLTYEGFYWNNTRIGFGKLFFRESARIEYLGTFFNDMKHGAGMLYDYNGNVVYEGIWHLDSSSSNITSISHITVDFSAISCGTENLVINGMFLKKPKMKNFTLYEIPQLKEIVICGNFLQYIKSVSIRRCHQLSYIYIKGLGLTKKRYKGSLNIQQCNQLKVIKLPNGTLACFYLCEMSGKGVRLIFRDRSPFIEKDIAFPRIRKELFS